MTCLLLDPGHGGMAFKHYLTPGKRSPAVPPGIYEGAFNRRVCDELAKGDDPNGMRILNIAPGPINVPLKARYKFANQLSRKEDCVLISIHANAAGNDKEWTDAEGFVVFHPKKANKKTKRLAKLIEEEMSIHLQGKISSRGIKKANHTVTANTNCPAVLVECGFMDNKEEAEFMASANGVKTFAQAIHSAMERYEEGEG